MLVYLVRTSLEAAAEGGARFLSLEGRQVIRALATKIRLSEEPSFDRFITSPVASAVQTAELFADRTDYLGAIETLPLLAGPTPAEVIAPHLLARGERIVLVADEPLLSSIGAFLVGRPTFPPTVHAQVSVIEDRRPAWCLRPGELGKQLLLVA